MSRSGAGGAGVPSRLRKGWRGHTRSWLAPLLLALVLLLGWQATTSASGWPEFLLPSPPAVARRLVTDLSAAATWQALATTMLESLGGCLLGCAVGLPLAVAIHESRWFSAAVNPFLGATQAIPAVALAPLLVLWVGYGMVPVMVLCALMVFFPILVSSLVGLRHVDPEVVDASRMDGAGRASRLWWIEAPLALPNMLAGLRNGFTLSITGAVVGEMVMGGDGLGQVLSVERDANDTVGMFSTLLVLCTVASAIYQLIRFIELRSSPVDSKLRSSPVDSELRSRLVNSQLREQR